MVDPFFSFSCSHSDLSDNLDMHDPPNLPSVPNVEVPISLTCFFITDGAAHYVRACSQKEFSGSFIISR
jgi:hypothetical protein